MTDDHDSLPDPDELIIQALADLDTRPVQWLWHNRLGLGKLTLFDGDPGLGKSLVTLDLCARITTGRPFPDGCPGPVPSNVLIFQGEDTPEDVINPRLDALGADRARVFQIQRRGNYGAEHLRFPGHLPLLEAALARLKPLLVVIDPIMAFFDTTVAVANDPSVRRVLTPLALMAYKYACAVILVRHLNKCASRRSVYRGAGSMAFLAACRSAWLFAQHPGRRGQTVVAPNKTNLAEPQPALAFEVLNGADNLPELRWCGPCVLTAQDLCKWADRGYPARLRARDFLTGILKDGPQPSKLIWETALKLGLARATINRAKGDLHVCTQRTIHGTESTYYWHLEHHAPPLSSDPDIRAFEERLERARAALPARNPLDEPQ